MGGVSQEHVHWKDLLVDTFPAGVPPQRLFPHSRLRILTRRDRHSGARSQHDHDYFELVLVRAGHAQHRSLYGEKPIARGDVLILPPRIWHGYADCRDLEIFNCCVGEETFQQHLPFILHDSFWNTFLSPVAVARQSQWEGNFRLAPRHFPAIEASFQQLSELTQQPFGLQTNYRLLAALINVLGQLAEGLQGQARLVPTPPTPHPLVQRALALIEQEVGRDWRVDELCERLNGVNSAYFIRLFKRNIGLTPKAYIANRRIEKAASRLLTTDDPVTEIAIDLGWNDPNLFSRTFRQFLGMSPTEYRAARR